jgi:RecB family exonuclease
LPSPPQFRPPLRQSSASAVVTPEADAADSYLIAPSATLAEQAAFELAWRGFPLRPSRIGTLEQFLDSWCAGWGIPPAATQPLLHMLIGQALAEPRASASGSRLSALRESRQLHAALAGLLEEIPPEASAPQDLANVFQKVRRDLVARGVALRQTRLHSAAARIREGAGPLPARVIFEGFLTPQPAEQELVEALRMRTTVIIHPPDIRRAAPRCVLFSAATPEREAEEIARRTLDYAAQGRPFRDIAIVLRSRDPYSGIVETALGRFGIPFRSYFGDPLASHPAIGFLSRIVQSLLDGWDHAKLLSALRMRVSGVSATLSGDGPGDRFDFALREHLPGRGLHVLDGLPEKPALLEKLAPMEDWRTAENEPRAWAERLKTLGKLLPLPAVATSHDEVFAARSDAAAIRAFQAALNQTAEFLPLRPIPLAEFWRHVETALALEELRVEDRRHDVVHIADVFEARRWNPPIVFICGLLERIFPLYHREDPLVGDALRARWGLSTAAQRQQEERNLFDLAVTRASEEAVLSYPRLDEKGAETIPSSFLDGAVPLADARGSEASKLSRDRKGAVINGPIQHPALTTRLARQHRKLSPTAIESFLQCPFQFFARRTLDLRPRPKAPQERLDVLAQGSIMHRALAEWVRFPLLGAQVLHRVFEEECARLRIPPGYRTEAVRLELLRNFEALLRDSHIPPGSLTRVEQEFRFRLTPTLAIRGRIDRLDTAPSGEALVIDYKYSAGNKIRERVEESEGGNLVQAGLYMLAAERALNREPAGMLYCGVKKQVAWGGWHVDIPGMQQIGESRTRAALRELIDDAAGRAAEVYQEIASGNVAVRPLDPDKCGWCDYRDACRIETRA